MRKMHTNFSVRSTSESALTKIMLAGFDVGQATADKDWPEAIKRWQAILDEFGDDAPVNAWIGLSSALRKISKSKQADEVIRAGLGKYPSDPGLETESAEIANDDKDWPEAIKRWQAILDSTINNIVLDISKRLYVRYNISLLKRLSDIDSYRSQINRHAQSNRTRRIAVYTSYTDDYDALKLPEIVDDRLDYIAYTDNRVDGMGIFDIRPLNQPMFNKDGSRASRYPKMHPHILLKNYDVVIWLDASMMIVGDIMPMIEAFIASGKAIGNATHPHRQSLDEEFEACIDLKKDDIEVLKQQANFYREIGFDTRDLANNGVLLYNLKHKKLAPVLETWWEQVCKFSKRDQLSFNYALFKNRAERFNLTKKPDDIRNCDKFIFVPHRSEQALLTELYSSLSSK